MAKRKRLTPAQPGFLDAPGAATAPAPVAPVAQVAPIAQVTGEASARAALEDLAAEVAAARARGLMLELLPLEAIDDHYLVRDRLEQDEDEMETLIASLRARGQQTPIEVVRLPEPRGAARFGLISGWRRLTALRRLYAGGSEPDFGTIRAVVIAPQDAQAAYVAMVEENEIRVNLSLYERARIALRAMHEGVYPTTRAALQGLYTAISRSKRSKIGSFMTLVEALDSVLRFPTAIPEKLGLALVREIERDAEFGARLRARLRAAQAEEGRVWTAEEELRLLSEAVAAAGAAPAAASAAVKAPAPEPAAPARPRVRTPGVTPDPNERLLMQASAGVQLRFTAGQNRIELIGDAVDADLCAALRDWLRRR